MGALGDLLKRGKILQDFQSNNPMIDHKSVGAALENVEAYKNAPSSVRRVFLDKAVPYLRNQRQYIQRETDRADSSAKGLAMDVGNFSQERFANVSDAMFDMSEGAFMSVTSQRDQVCSRASSSIISKYLLSVYSTHSSMAQAPYSYLHGTLQ